MEETWFPLMCQQRMFEWTVFRRNSIVAGKSDDLGDFESFVSGENISFFVGVLVNKGFDTDSGRT